MTDFLTTQTFKQQFTLLAGRVLGLILLLLLARPISSQENSISQEVDLTEFIVMVTNNDYMFQQILIDEMFLQYNETLGLPTSDFILSLRGQYDFSLGASGTNRKVATLNLEKLFINTGTVISTGYTTSTASRDFTTTTGVSAITSSVSQVKSVFNVAITQPIARNAFGKINRLQKKIIGFENIIAHYQVVEAYEDYLASVTQLYLDWLLAYQNYLSAKQAADDYLKLLNVTRKKRRFRIANRADVSKIEWQMKQRQNQMLQQQLIYKQKWQFVKSATGLSNPSATPKPLYLFETLNKSMFAKSRTNSLYTTIKKRGLLAIERASSELLPSTNLIIGYNRSGSGLDLGDAEDRGYAGFIFEFPIQSSIQRAAKKVSQLQNKKDNLTTKNSLIQLKNNLAELRLALKFNKDIIDNSNHQLTLLDQIIKDDRRNYALAKITLNELLTYINNRNAARRENIGFKLQRLRLKIEWLRLTDQLVTESDFKKHKTRLQQRQTRPQEKK